MLPVAERDADRRRTTYPELAMEPVAVRLAERDRTTVPEVEMLAVASRLALRSKVSAPPSTDPETVMVPVAETAACRM